MSTAEPPDGARAAARALRKVLVWPPDLAPTDRFVPLADLDLAAYAEAVCRRLGGPPARVGWSAVVMGLASRLWSVSVVPFATDGVVIDPGCLLASDDDGALVLGVREPGGAAGGSVADLEAAVRAVLVPLVTHAAVAAGVSERLLWGNVAASLHAVPRVHDLPAAAGVVGTLLAHPDLADELVVTGGRARRTTCCLFYLAPGAGLCGDCVFDRVPRGRDAG